MNTTTLIFSTHGHSPRIHGDFLAARALAHSRDSRVLYLPMSEPPHGRNDRASQEFGWSRFVHAMEPYRTLGVEPVSFFWSGIYQRRDLEHLFEMLENVPVVVLGNGTPSLGMWRFQMLSHELTRDPQAFGRMLLRRQRRGLLTAGSSAGALQLGSIFDVRGTQRGPFRDGFRLADGVAVDVHHEGRRRRWLRGVARRRKRVMWFGLPNNSAVAVSSGRLRSGYEWQLLRFVLDSSAPLHEGWHVKTSHGERIEHYYPDGRHWAFGNDDAILRVRRRRRKLYSHAWIASAGRVMGMQDQAALPVPDLGSLLRILGD